MLKDALGKMREGGIAMEEKTYFVSMDIGPRSGEIRTTMDMNNPTYDYEIRATDKELSRLQQLFEQVQKTDFATFFKAHLPYEIEERMMENKKEDQQIREIY